MAMTLLCPKYGFSDRLAGVCWRSGKMRLSIIKVHYFKGFMKYTFFTCWFCAGAMVSLQND
jgi:hypothetical protein